MISNYFACSCTNIYCFTAFLPQLIAEFLIKITVFRLIYFSSIRFSIIIKKIAIIGKKRISILQGTFSTSIFAKKSYFFDARNDCLLLLLFLLVYSLDKPKSPLLYCYIFFRLITSSFLLLVYPEN